MAKTTNIPVIKRYAVAYLAAKREIARAEKRLARAADQIRRRVQLGARLTFGNITIARVPTEAHTVPAYTVNAGERLQVTKHSPKRPAATPESLADLPSVETEI